jgi:hypothetical protein
MYCETRRNAPHAKRVTPASRAISTDVAVYNDLNRDQSPLPMLFDFRDDIAERQTWEDDAA